MKILRSYILFILICFGIVSVSFAQKNTVSAGGNISGTGGSVSYSIGQIDHLSKSDVAGNVTEGLQQPYEISVVTGAQNADIVLSMSVYPNPAIDQLTLKVGDSGVASLSFSLFDLSGKLIETRMINFTSVDISMKELSAGVYFLKIYNNNSEIKVFKIIKN